MIIFVALLWTGSKRSMSLKSLVCDVLANPRTPLEVLDGRFSVLFIHQRHVVVISVGRSFLSFIFLCVFVGAFYIFNNAIVVQMNKWKNREEIIPPNPSKKLLDSGALCYTYMTSSYLSH